MKKFLPVFFCLSILAFIACGGKKTDDKIESKEDVSSLSWEQLAPDKLTIRPLEAFDKDWMALSVKTGKELNAMTVSWGQIGTLWGKPVVTVFVSEDRYTKKMLDECEYFTLTSFPKQHKYKEALVYLGSNSRKDNKEKLDKSGLTIEMTSLGNPLFKEGNLAIECKVLYKDEFKRELMPDNVSTLYENLGMHSFYIGEIVNIYVKE